MSSTFFVFQSSTCFLILSCLIVFAGFFISLGFRFLRTCFFFATLSHFVWCQHCLVFFSPYYFIFWYTTSVIFICCVAAPLSSQHLFFTTFRSFSCFLSATQCLLYTDLISLLFLPHSDLTTHHLYHVVNDLQFTVSFLFRYLDTWILLLHLFFLLHICISSAGARSIHHDN